MNKTFEDKIKPLMDIIDQLCNEEGIEFLAQFKLTENEFYHYTTRDMLLDTSTIISQYQKWSIGKNK